MLMTKSQKGNGVGLVDNYGRRIRKLRVSLLDACNFRCFYCMPEKPRFMKSDNYLSQGEIISLASELVDLGMEEVRVTGGEPLLRKEFREIILGLSELPLRKLGMTTNGLLLKKELPFLKDTSCQYLNISLDSLNKDNFSRITRSSNFDKVLSAILSARRMGFQVKINTVLMRGVNDFELEDFVRFSAENDIEVRFLEVMKIGQICKSQGELFVSADDAISRLKRSFELSLQNVEIDSTSFNYLTDTGAKIGFIASESKPFCGNCSRWRLSANGLLRACLMSEEAVNVRGIRTEDLRAVLNPLFAMKPIQRLQMVEQDMNQIGG